jgi:hypothetical protein
LPREGRGTGAEIRPLAHSPQLLILCFRISPVLATIYREAAFSWLQVHTLQWQAVIICPEC